MEAQHYSFLLSIFVVSIISQYVHCCEEPCRSCPYCPVAATIAAAVAASVSADSDTSHAGGGLLIDRM